MSILGQVKVPNDMDSPMVGGFNPSKENFDSYLTKLQNICTENLGSEDSSANKTDLNTTMPTSI